METFLQINPFENLIFILKSTFFSGFIYGSHEFVYYFSVSENNKKCRQIKEAINTFGHNADRLFQLLLNTAQFEFLLKEVGATSN